MTVTVQTSLSKPRYMRYSAIASARVNGAVLRKFIGPDGKIVM